MSSVESRSRSVGWRLDAEVSAGEDVGVVQLTPPGSACSSIFGAGVSSQQAGEELPA